MAAPQRRGLLGLLPAQLPTSRLADRAALSVAGAYLAARAWQLAALGPPIVAPADSQMYRGPAQGWLDFGDVSLTGDALRPWPVTLLFALMPSDEGRVLAQFAIGCACWAFCVYQVARLPARASVTLPAALAVAALALTAGVSSWDALILSESLSLSLSALLVGSLAALARRPDDLVQLALAGAAALLLALLRPPLALLPLAVAFIPAVPWLRQRQRLTVLPVAAAVIAIAVTGYALWYGARSDLAWGRMSGVPGENGRTIQQYAVIVDLSPIGGALVHDLAGRGAPACLTDDYDPHSSLAFPQRLLPSCASGVDWISHSFFPNLAAYLITHPATARRYFAPALREADALRADGMASLPTPIPGALSEVFFAARPGAGSPLLLWFLAAAGVIAWRSRLAGLARELDLLLGPSALALAAIVGLAGTAFLSPVDVSRVGLPATVLLRLGLLLLVVAGLGEGPFKKS